MSNELDQLASYVSNRRVQRVDIPSYTGISMGQFVLRSVAAIVLIIFMITAAVGVLLCLAYLQMGQRVSKENDDWSATKLTLVLQTPEMKSQLERDHQQRLWAAQTVQGATGFAAISSISMAVFLLAAGAILLMVASLAGAVKDISQNTYYIRAGR